MILSSSTTKLFELGRWQDTTKESPTDRRNWKKGRNDNKFIKTNSSQEIPKDAYRKKSQKAGIGIMVAIMVALAGVLVVNEVSKLNPDDFEKLFQNIPQKIQESASATGEIITGAINNSPEFQEKLVAIKDKFMDNVKSGQDTLDKSLNQNPKIKNSTKSP